MRPAVCARSEVLLMLGGAKGCASGPMRQLLLLCAAELAQHRGEESCSSSQDKQFFAEAD